MDFLITCVANTSSNKNNFTVLKLSKLYDLPSYGIYFQNTPNPKVHDIELDVCYYGVKPPAVCVETHML